MRGGDFKNTLGKEVLKSLQILRELEAENVKSRKQVLESVRAVRPARNDMAVDDYVATQWELN